MGVDIEDIVGESTAKRIEHARDRSWTILDAMTTDYTHQEEHPPRGSPITMNTRIRVGNISGTIIDTAQMEYDVYSDTEAIKKLLRVGIPEIDLEWGDKIDRINQAERAITITSGYLIEGGLSADDIGEEIVSIDTENQRSKQCRIFWYQTYYAGNIADELNIQKSSVLQLAILLAGRELGYVGDIPEPSRINLGGLIESIGDQITHRVTRVETMARGNIVSVLNSEYDDEALDKLKSECPGLLERVQKDLVRACNKLN